MSPDVGIFEQRFEEDYTKLFGRPVAGMDIEITVWSVNATTPPEQVTPIKEAQAKEGAPPSGRRGIFDAAKAGFCDSSLVQRDAMTTGQFIHGPAAITEDETTIIVPSSRTAICQADGCIDVIIKGDAS